MRKAQTTNRGEGAGRLLRPAWLCAALMLALLPHPIAAEPNETGVALDNPDFAAMSRAAGIFALRVEDPGELPGAVAEFLAFDGPSLLDVRVARNELSIPPKIDGQQVKGFSLYMLRAVMSGRGDSVLDLAKTNLIR